MPSEPARTRWLSCPCSASGGGAVVDTGAASVRVVRWLTGLKSARVRDDQRC